MLWFFTPEHFGVRFLSRRAVLPRVTGQLPASGDRTLRKQLRSICSLDVLDSVLFLVGFPIKK